MLMLLILIFVLWLVAVLLIRIDDLFPGLISGCLTLAVAACVMYVLFIIIFRNGVFIK